MFTIDLTSNIEMAAAELSDVELRQIPFAASLTLNATIKDVRRRIVGVTYPKAFQVRNKAFPGVMFRMKFSRKTDLEAILFDRLERDFMERHVTGGVKRPFRGSHLAIPINVKRTGGGRIPKNKKPRALTAKKSTRIIRGKGGKNLIVERFKGETIVRYVLSPSANIKSHFRFYEDAVDTVNRVIDGHFNASMRRAARPRRVL